MKNSIPVLLSVLFLATTAHAEIPCDFGFYDFDSSVCALKLSTFLPILSTLALSSGHSADKQAYVGQLRDDAAAYVGSDGTEIEGAVLRDSIAQIRAQEAGIESVSDLEIAKILMNAN